MSRASIALHAAAAAPGEVPMEGSGAFGGGMDDMVSDDGIEVE